MTRAVDIFKHNWGSEIKTKDKLRLYRNFKLCFQQEAYLNLNMDAKFRRYLACIRSSGLGLAVEEGRSLGIDFEERICKICGSLEIEDEYHSF